MLTVEEFINTCREKGLNVTYQRVLIYKTLAATKSHPTAEEIYEKVREEYPAISLATVYKTLETLAEHHLIDKVTPLHDLARYDGNPEPHHHLVCVHCRKVVDVDEDPGNDIRLPRHDQFQIYGYRLQYEGICRECAEKLGDGQQKASVERVSM
ncbi:MAG: transcriptional repressor [Calditrichaeota bacterium]|nr:MAG: transcriptional repressor [Calditrichota bacterium]